MKKASAILFILCWSILSVWSLQTSKQVTFQWDALTDVSILKVRIYDTLTVPETMVAEVACTPSPWLCPTQLTTVMPRAAHQYVARSVNADWESTDSNVVIVPGPPQRPTGLKK